AYVDLSPNTSAPPPDLHAALDLLHHRGPDGQGVWTAPSVGLGHARLSIMDVQHGAQPMHDESDSVHAVVNGEFYDFEVIRADLAAKGHVFRTHSDSEILVHLYNEHGLNCVQHLQGEFAFVLYDSRRRRLVLCRDRYGVKPLYYTIVQNRLLVASEAKAFLAMGWTAQWDMASIADSGYFTDTRTLFQGVSKVRPSSYMTVSAFGTITTDVYFAPVYPDKRQVDVRSVDEMVEGVRSRLLAAVRSRLRSDVPVAIYLSGGVDSSSVLGMATSILRETDPTASLDAFTIAFSDKTFAGVKYDESPIAERTASHFGAKFHALRITQEALTDAFEDAVWHWEAPLNDFNGASKFLLSRFVRDAGYKVVLTGEGSDEHFGGYSMFYPDFFREATAPPIMTEARRLELLEQIEAQAPIQYARIGCVPMSYSDHVIGRRLLNSASIHRILSSMYGLPSDLFADKSLEAHTVEAYALGLSAVERELAHSTWHPFHTSMALVTHTLLPNVLCTHLGDRSEMAHSLEGRVPFLDHRVTSYVDGLPPQVKLKVNAADGTITDKWILREAVKPFLTDELFNRPKFPFLAPPTEFDRDAVHWKKLEGRVTQEAVARLGWMDWAFVHATIDKFKSTNDRQAQNILNQVMSFIVLQERFNIPTWTLDVSSSV
ncbi:hypothetical protein As57867_003835, partial [Aphanomyces stellatus]